MYGGVPSDAIFTGTDTEYVETINLSTMQVVKKEPVLISVNYIRKIDGKPIVGQPDMIRLDFGETEYPMSITKRWRTLDYTGYNQSIITVNEALEKLEHQDVMLKPVCKDCFMNAVIKNMTLGLYEDTSDHQEIIFQPVWIFEGNSASGLEFYNYVYAKKFCNFTSRKKTGSAPLEVILNDTSTDTPLRWRWDFGDGTNSTEQNPVHIFKSPGSYTVSLWVWDGIASDTTEKTGYITVRNPAPPIASFTATPTTGKVPLTVQFTDTSLNTPTSWLWDFGDGTTATAQNPDHTYQIAGIYTITLTAINADGSESKTMPEYITVIPLIKPIANFTATPTSGKAPLAVKFTDLSANGPLAWAWRFGDGYVSMEQNPVHRYDVSGMYAVALDATNADGSDTKTRTDYITVINPDNPTDLIDQLIIYINNQNNVPKMFRLMWTGQLKEVKQFLDNNNPSDAVVLMKYFKFSVGFFKGWIITNDQAATMQNSADAIIRGINLPVNQQAIDQIKSLSADVKNLKLPASVENSLTLELEGTLFTLECAKDQAAVSYLNLFISSVKAQDGKKIPHDMAVQLMAKAEGIIKTIKP